MEAYSLILASPEVFLVHGSKLLLCIIHNGSCAFTKRLAYIIINKTHLIWGWRSFKNKYADLRILRYYYLKVPLIALSTILTPHILEYICKLLHIYNFIYMYKRPIDYPNIMQIIANIKK